MKFHDCPWAKKESDRKRKKTKVGGVECHSHIHTSVSSVKFLRLDYGKRKSRFANVTVAQKLFALRSIARKEGNNARN